jgi:hypothetical protein
VGRAEAVQYDASSYKPQPPELRYFLTEFVVKDFSRIRSTLQREYPDSLFFLEPALADATIAQNEQSRLLETFVTNPSADEIEVLVQNVSLSELTTPPFKAAVTFQKVYYTPVRAGPRRDDARGDRPASRWDVLAVVRVLRRGVACVMFSGAALRVLDAQVLRDGES